MMNLVLSRIRSRGTKAGGERGSGTLLLAAVGVGFIAAVWMSLFNHGMVVSYSSCGRDV